jgi:transcriptional regulator with XRE-family HTH domain
VGALMGERTALYRFYDIDDQLLYVGITDNIPARWEGHARNKRWWSDVVRKVVEWHDDREAAALAEIAAIVAERPLYNVVHVPGRRSEREETSAPLEVENGRPPAARFYDAVVSALASRGLNKLKLHELTGVARSTIDGWRTQTRPPYAEKILIVAEALGIDKEEALRLAGVVADPVITLGGEPVSLSQVPASELLAELARRLSA